MKKKKKKKKACFLIEKPRLRTISFCFWGFFVIVVVWGVRGGGAIGRMCLG